MVAMTLGLGRRQRRPWFQRQSAQEKAPSKTGKIEAAASPHAYGDGSNMRTAKEIKNLFDGNLKWVERKKSSGPNYFGRLGMPHEPTYFWIGCCDARVPADRLVGLEQGEVFISRNIGNQVISGDLSVMAALQYAVDVLGVEHIVVCGHYDCGGVRAAMKNQDFASPLSNWLMSIRDTHRLHEAELQAIVEPEAKHRRLVELNAIEQCLNLFKTGVVQRRRAETANWSGGFTVPRIHAVVYDPKEGILKELDVDFRSELKRFSNIYRVYDSELMKESRELEPAA